MKGFAGVVGLAVLGLVGPVSAQDVPVEVKTLGKQQITLHLHDFLTEEERATLQVVASNEEALALFVTRPGRHAAIAVSPREGFIRNGQPVASAVALSDLRDAETARKDAIADCGAAKKSGPDCVIVLEVAPAR